MFRIILFFIFLIPSTLNALSFDGKFMQGHFIIGKTQPETEIWIDKKKVIAWQCFGGNFNFLFEQITGYSSAQNTFSF